MFDEDVDGILDLEEWSVARAGEHLDHVTQLRVEKLLSCWRLLTIWHLEIESSLVSGLLTAYVGNFLFLQEFLLNQKWLDDTDFASKTRDLPLQLDLV